MNNKIPCAELNKPCPIDCRNKVCKSPAAFFRYKMNQLDDLFKKESTTQGELKETDEE